MFKKLLALSLLLAVAPFGLASSDAAHEGPAPNQKCGLSTVGNKVQGPVAIAGYGDSVGDALADALGNVSGVVCEICDNGIQCEREVILSQTSSFTTGVVITEGDDGSICLMGTLHWAKVTVTCHNC